MTYTGTTLTLEDGTVLASGPGGGGTFGLAFPRPGDHRLVATCSTAGGDDIVSGPVSARVRAAAPPAFTVSSPVEGVTLDLNEGGGTVEVRLAFPAGQFFPLTVDVIHDGLTITTGTAGAVTYAGP